MDEVARPAVPLEKQLHRPLVMAFAVVGWHDFRARGLRYNDTLFDPEEVPGDGNCFFHSLARSGFRARLDSLSKESCYGALLKHSAPLELKLDLEE
jgi:hypothetical protein